MKKVVVIGPESTGKSTLCRQLAAHYETSWCPEYARAYLEQLNRQYTFEDLLEIGKGQLALEERICAEAANGLCFIDTNMYVIQVWSEYVFGKCDHRVLEEIVARKYDLYLLCDVDLPWTFDPLREYPDEYPRRELFSYYKQLMIEQSVPWKRIHGSDNERLQHAIAAVSEII